MAPTRILVFAGSIRTNALSAKLAALAAKELALAEAQVTHISLADYPLPLYDGDLEQDRGVPENATKLARLIAASQGVFIATPEYNNSLPPLLKNAIDWISRHRNSSIPYRSQGLRHRQHIGRGVRRSAGAGRPAQGADDGGARHHGAGEDRDPAGPGRL